MMGRHPSKGRDGWLAIELRHLAALDAIDLEGTFSEAALRLGYVQSAVSGQLATLERLTSVQLVERARGQGPQRLTPAGQLLVAHARAIFAELEAARRDVEDSDEPPPAGLRLALASGLSDACARKVIASVVGRYGHRVASVRTMDADAVVASLRDRQIDVALVDLPLGAPSVATAEIARLPLEVVVQQCSPLARGGRAPNLDELANLPLVVWREGRDPTRLETELEARGLRPDVVARVDSSDAVVPLVRAGLGVAVLPAGAVAADEELIVLPIADGLPARAAGVAWLRERSSEVAVRRFVDRACRLREEALAAR